MALRIAGEGFDTIEAGMARLGDVDRLLEPILEAHLEAAELAFERNASPDGRPWAPLRPESLRGPRVGGPLERSGAMRASLAAVRSDGDSGEVGSPLAYAGVPLGGSRTTPARPYLGPISDDELGRIVSRYVDEAVDQ